MVVSQIQTPRNSTPLSRYSSYTLLRMGASSIHGGHQDAQKSTSTTLPLRSPRLTEPPCRSLQGEVRRGLLLDANLTEVLVDSQGSRLSAGAEKRQAQQGEEGGEHDHG